MTPLEDKRGLEGLPPAQILQNAYVVNDIEAACHRMHAIHRLGPFIRLDATMTNHLYFGERTEDVKLSVAFATSGGLSIELLQQISDTPSGLRLAFPKGSEGLHHVARFAVDYQAERDALVEAGFPVVSEFDGAPEDCRVSFIDTRPVLGHMIELYTDHPALRGVYSYVEEATAAWDGTELIQSFPV